MRMERDLFGSVLYQALQRKINMEEVLTYPLKPIPLSLCHIDGKMSKTTKLTLTNVVKWSHTLKILQYLQQDF